MSLEQLHPICLPGALWTNTKRSFLQMICSTDNSRGGAISRADEFIQSYYCRPEVLVPRASVPPFGSTRTDNLSLEVRSHYLHRHTPLSWRTYWVQSSGTRLPASPRHPITPSPPVQIQYFDTMENKLLKEYVPNLNNPFSTWMSYL